MSNKLLEDNIGQVVNVEKTHGGLKDLLKLIETSPFLSGGDMYKYLPPPYVSTPFVLSPKIIKKLSDIIQRIMYFLHLLILIIYLMKLKHCLKERVSKTPRF